MSSEPALVEACELPQPLRGLVKGIETKPVDNVLLISTVTEHLEGPRRRGWDRFGHVTIVPFASLFVFV